MDFGRPNAETGRKMANGRLLFLALHAHAHTYTRAPIHTFTHIIM